MALGTGFAHKTDSVPVRGGGWSWLTTLLSALCILGRPSFSSLLYLGPLHDKFLHFNSGFFSSCKIPRGNS